jgi:hypothetical protein
MPRNGSRMDCEYKRKRWDEEKMTKAIIAVRYTKLGYLKAEKLFRAV